jgi:alanyl-tRNA synthetase
MRNHSVTHLMHKALREVLGTHVQQRGSLVDADKTRFDFSHNKPMSEQQIREVERA